MANVSRAVVQLYAEILLIWTVRLTVQSLVSKVEWIYCKLYCYRQNTALKARTVRVYSSVENCGMSSAGWCCSDMAAYCGGNWTQQHANNHSINQPDKIIHNAVNANLMCNVFKDFTCRVCCHMLQLIIYIHQSSFYLKTFAIKLKQNDKTQHFIVIPGWPGLASGSKWSPINNMWWLLVW